MNTTIILFILSFVFLILAIIFTSIHKKCDTNDDDCEKKQKTYKNCFIAFWILFAIFFARASYEFISPSSKNVVYYTPEGLKTGKRLMKEARKQAQREAQARAKAREQPNELNAGWGM